jgi:hypothetical protein
LLLLITLNETYRIGMIPGWGIGSSQRSLLDNRHHSRQKEIHTPDGIRTRSEKLQTHTLDRVATVICFIFPTRICMLILLIKEWIFIIDGRYIWSYNSAIINNNVGQNNKVTSWSQFTLTSFYSINHVLLSKMLDRKQFIVYITSPTEFMWLTY